MYSYAYPRPALTADCVVFSTGCPAGNMVLLVRRGNEPFKGRWALPGGFMDMDETLEQCARRELKEETGIVAPPGLEEVGSFSTVDRDPRGRTVTVAFVAVVPYTEAHGGDDACDAQWFPLGEIPPLAFDHEAILHKAAALKGFVL